MLINDSPLLDWAHHTPKHSPTVFLGRAASELGQGTTFEIFLPKVEAAVSRSVTPEDADSMPRGIETVLLVEDEPTVREVAARTLRHQGYTVLEANDGYHALNVTEERADGPIDLLLTDVVMPLMGGRELAAKLRSRRPETKVLYTSGYIGDAIIQHDVLEPDTEFIGKPFTPAGLAQKVRAVLSR